MARMRSRVRRLVTAAKAGDEEALKELDAIGRRDTVAHWQQTQEDYPDAQWLWRAFVQANHVRAAWVKGSYADRLRSVLGAAACRLGMGDRSTVEIFGRAAFYNEREGMLVRAGFDAGESILVWWYDPVRQKRQSAIEWAARKGELWYLVEVKLSSAAWLEVEMRAGVRGRAALEELIRERAQLGKRRYAA